MRVGGTGNSVAEGHDPGDLSWDDDLMSVFVVTVDMMFHKSLMFLLG